MCRKEFAMLTVWLNKGTLLVFFSQEILGIMIAESECFEELVFFCSGQLMQ